jgi:hypothetical protein
MKGVPANSPILVRIDKTSTFKNVSGDSANDKYCISVKSSELKFMPLGERFYINFDPAEFGDSEFEVTYGESGMLTKVALNSKSSAGMEQFNSLLSSVLPYVKKSKSAIDPAGLAAVMASAKEKEKHCLLVKTEVIGVKLVNIQ